MDYPTEEEEFEMMYQDELEMMDEAENDCPNPVTIIRMPDSQQPCTSKSVTESVLNSPQLSQISFGSSASVNRRLFNTPSGPKRISSTPYTGKNQINHRQPDPLAEIQNIGVSRKRRLEDLFGDIRDIDMEEETYIDVEAKKMKSEEQRDLELIEKINEARKKLQEVNNPLKKDHIEKLNALHDFKKRNLSHSVPNFPFIPIVQSDADRIYCRFHSEEFYEKVVGEIECKKGFNNLLGENKERVWNEANEITLKRMTAGNNEAAPLAQSQVEVINSSVANENLWVEKYKPRKYIDLLSDESTNRTLLYWLRMWDKVVFNREFTTTKPNPGQLNTFNKRTGRFESTGGWNRRLKQNLDTECDEHGRPMQKIALLCGPPGLGKTTLAHTIARHAGYSIREINASDDRSPEAFRLALENGTQMTSVLNQDKKPNCIILDEIDGAPQQSIEFLIKFITGTLLLKSTKGNKPQKHVLKRPIICICNDMYVPALRQLRQVAFVVNFPPIESARLAERLLEIAKREGVKTDLSSLLALAEKSGNDIRSCISMMQFFNAMKKPLTLVEVLKSNLGQKDRHRGLFGVWSAIFQIQRPRRRITEQKDDNTGPMVTLTDMSQNTRAQHILEVVHMGGDYERLMQGVYENYLSQKMPDPNLFGVVEATEWFCFSDQVQSMIHHLQNYEIYPYLQFGFVTWHLLFGSLAWPKITFPNKNFEFNQKVTTQKMIFQSLRRGIASDVVGIGHGRIMLLDTITLLKRILSPNLRSVSLQLLSPKERYDLKHSVEVMADFGLSFTQTKSVDGTYQYQIEPDIDFLCHFPGYPTVTLSYFGKQLIAREVELEQMRRVAPKVSTNAMQNTNKNPLKKKIDNTLPKNLPNHLQTLKPKIIRHTNMKETVSKDFFGRTVTKQSNLTVQEGGTDVIVKSPIWYRYKEGFNNAVRKDVIMSDIL